MEPRSEISEPGVELGQALEQVSVAVVPAHPGASAFPIEDENWQELSIGSRNCLVQRWIIVEAQSVPKPHD